MSDDFLKQYLEYRGIKQPSSPPITITAPTSFVSPYTTGPAPGASEGAAATTKSADAIYQDLTKQHLRNGIAELNLRNLADVYKNLQGGIGVPYESKAGQLLIWGGLDPNKFGLTNPAYAQEAEKAASAALRSTLGYAPHLVTDIEEAKNLKPGATLQPDAARSLIVNGLTNLAVSEQQLKHMEDHIKKNNGSLYGYTPGNFTPDAAAIQDYVYGTLPQPKGGGKTEQPTGRPVEGTAPVVTPSPGTSMPQLPQTKTPTSAGDLSKISDDELKKLLGIK